MCTAKVLVDEKKNPFNAGTDATEPAVNINAALSPTILPIARITPERIPGTAAGITITNIVLSFPAPSPKLPSLYMSGTSYKGFFRCSYYCRNIIANVSTPAINEYPHLNANTNARNPNNPNTIDGIPARVSVVTLITFTSFDPLLEYSTR